MASACLEAATTDDSTNLEGISIRTLLAEAEPLPCDEQARLVAAAQAGNTKARNTLIEKNLRLVASIVRIYKNLAHSLDEADLFQEGVLGLANAIDTFDFNLGCKFSTHATNNIKKTILRALGNLDAPIRIPKDMNTLSRKVEATAQRLGQSDTNSQESLETIAAATSIPTERIRELLSLPYVASSTDEKLSEGSKDSILDIKADPRSTRPEDEAIISDLRTVISRSLKRLPEAMQKIIVCRYGLNDHQDPCSPKEASQRLGIPLGYLRWLEAQALRELRIMLPMESSYSTNS